MKLAQPATNCHHHFINPDENLDKTSKTTGTLPRSKQNKIPLVIKLAYTLFVMVLVPVYLREYGPTNFLWFCDMALLLTLVGLWLESSLLVSMCAVGILIPQFLWIADFVSNALGFRLVGLTGYMFDHGIPVYIRALSLFHGWLPVLLLWLLGRLGYDQRALTRWTILASASILICYFFTPAAGVHLANPNTPRNINNIYGFNDDKPQAWLNQNLYVILWIGALWLGAFLPTHLVLRKIFTDSASCQPDNTAPHPERSHP